MFYKACVKSSAIPVPMIEEEEAIVNHVYTLSARGEAHQHIANSLCLLSDPYLNFSKIVSGD